MNATDAVRSGDAAGRLVFGSRNENTNRFGPTACWELTMTGITLGLPAAVDADGAPVGAEDAQPTTTAASSTSMAASDRGMRRA